VCIIWLTVSSLMGPKMNARQQRYGKQMGPKINARQQCHVGALGITLGETQVRGSPGHTQGSPPAHLGSPLRHPTGVSIAALCSPARTGRATSHHRPPSSPPPPPKPILVSTHSTHNTPFIPTNHSCPTAGGRGGERHYVAGVKARARALLFPHLHGRMRTKTRAMMQIVPTATPRPAFSPVLRLPLPLDGAVGRRLVNGTTLLDRGVAPLKAGAWVRAVKLGSAVVLLGFGTLDSRKRWHGTLCGRGVFLQSLSECGAYL
jgi:hypothetical protein